MSAIDPRASPAKSRSGVFRCHRRSGSKSPLTLSPATIRTISTPLHAVRDKNGFLNAIAQSLQFPQHFGRNWDAFYDCLLDLDPQEGLLLVFPDASGFARGEPEEFAAAVDTLADAADYWKENGRSLAAVFELEAPALAPELAEVSCPGA